MKKTVFILLFLPVLQTLTLNAAQAADAEQKKLVQRIYSIEQVQQLNKLNANYLRIQDDEEWTEKTHLIKTAVEKIKLHPDDIMWGGQPIVITAVAESQHKAAQLLLANKADANQQDQDGVPLLFHAKDCAMAKLLLDHKADINCRRTFLAPGRTYRFPVLHQVDENPGLVLTFWQAGADLSAVDAQGCTALIYQCELVGEKDPHAMRCIENLVKVGVPLDAQATIEGRQCDYKKVIELRMKNEQKRIPFLKSVLATIDAAKKERDDAEPQLVASIGKNLPMIPAGVARIIVSYVNPPPDSVNKDLAQIRFISDAAQAKQANKA